MLSSYGRWTEESVYYVIFGLAAVFFSISAVNVILIMMGVKRKVYFYANTIAQVAVSFILVGLLGVFGVVVLLLDTGILLTLGEKREKKPKPEEPFQTNLP